MALLTRSATIDLLRRYDLVPRGTLGQHFLADPNTIRKIVRLSAVGSGDVVVEVGAGLGALTAGLAQTGARVIAIEHDRALRAALEETLAPFDNVEVQWGDVMKIDLAGLGASAMVANLPYNIATPLLIETLIAAPAIEQYLVMVQREVGLRLVAEPGTSAYGAVSVKVAYLAHASVVSRISRRVFVPEPAVESVLVRLEVRERPPVALERERFFAFVDSAFAQRRKTLRNALRGAGASVEDVDAALEHAGIAASARAEDLSLEQLATVSAGVVVRGVRA